MTWATLLPIIIQYGLPVAEAIWAKAAAGKDPTAQDWTDLTALTARTAKSRVVVLLLNNGIDPTSEKGITLLALAA